MTQANLFNFVDDIGKRTGSRAYTTYKGMPIYNREYLLDAVKDAAGAELANMVQAYFEDMEQQASEQIADTQNDTKEVQADLTLLETAYNTAFSTLKDASVKLSDILYDDKRLSRAKLIKISQELTRVYYALRDD